MLSGKERELMNEIYSLTHRTGCGLIGKKELGARLTDGVDVEKVLSALKSDAYLDYLSSMRKGEDVYVITLLEKGKNFPRELRKEKEMLLFRLLLAVGGAIVSFLVGLILKTLWN